MSDSLHTRSPTHFNVAAWNILLDRTHGDKVRPQFDRLGDIALSLKHLRDDIGDLDIAALMEVEESQAGHHGSMLAESLGYTNDFWTRHSRKNEHIGFLGRAVSDTEVVNLGHNKKAVVTRLGDIAVAGLHLKFQLHGSERAEQMEALLEHIDGAKKAVIMGDFNSIPLERPRRILSREGFDSVFTLTDQPRPTTVPTPDYWHMPSWKRKVGITITRTIGIRMSVDDIYVKGLKVDAADYFIGNSDHTGIWAGLRDTTGA